MDNIFKEIEKKGYSFLEIIQEGGFGTVYNFTVNRNKNNLKKNDKVAIKIINLENRNDDNIHCLSRELDIDNEFIKKFNSLKYKKNLLKVYEIIKFESYSCIVMESMDTDLFEYLIDYIYNNKIFKDNKKIITLYFAREIIRGLENLSKLKIIHNDLKPENILINVNKNTAERICITDYGCAYFKKDKKDECGTFVYSSPELLKKIFDVDEKININEKSDIFSVGIILYKIYTIDDHPFDEFNPEIQMNIPIKEYEITDIIQDKFLSKLIFSMLQYDAVNRPSYTEILTSIEKEINEIY